ncbi:MAG: hypothetical protein DRI30_02415 [Chloroflexi bacterium]|nr:MAG: hypothetical protein DRI30_02415 [Chloroflexota bacterium]
MLGLAAVACGDDGSVAEEASAIPIDPVAGGNPTSMQVLSESHGWIARDGSLWITADGGESWTDISPEGLQPNSVKGIHFLDADHGWIMTNGARGSSDAIQLQVLRTSDAGRTWESSPMGEPSVDYTLSLGGPASFFFLDAQHGWAVVRLASSSQFNWGHLYRTQDGGVTWDELSVPLGEPVVFANEQDGFQTGGPVGDAFFVTHDGGASWEAAQLPIPSEFAATHPVYGRPSFFSALQGVLPVTFAADRSTLGVYTTSDGGSSWQLKGARATSLPLGVGLTIPSDVVDLNTVIAVPGGDKVYSTADQGETWSITSPNGLPAGVSDVDFASERVGWALVQSSECRSFKDDCSTASQAFKTADGGQTWVPLALD